MTDALGSKPGHDTANRRRAGEVADVGYQPEAVATRDRERRAVTFRPVTLLGTTAQTERAVRRPRPSLPLGSGGQRSALNSAWRRRSPEAINNALVKRRFRKGSFADLALGPFALFFYGCALIGFSIIGIYEAYN